MLVAGNVWAFALGRAAMSFSLGNSGLMMTTLSEQAPRNRLGLAFSIMNGAPPLGLFVGPLLGGIMMDTRGFSTLLTINSALILAIILVLTFGYRDNFKGTDRGALVRMAVDSLRIIWRSLRLRALFPALFLLFAGWVLAFTYIPLVITTLYHGSEPGKAVGMVVAVGGLATLVLSPVIGALADRFGHWKVLFIGAMAQVVLWPLPALARNLLSFVIAWALINGVASAVFAISFTVLSGAASSEVRGRVMSFAYLPVNVGSIVGPAIGSLVTRVSVFSVFPVAAMLTALGIGALFIASRLSP
jgi:MFS family permease